MLTVKFMKFGPQIAEHPTYTDAICVRTAKSVHVKFEKDLRSVVQLDDAPGDTYEVTVGANDCSFNVAYVMNDVGRTVETIR